MARAIFKVIIFSFICRRASLPTSFQEVEEPMSRAIFKVFIFSFICRSASFPSSFQELNVTPTEIWRLPARNSSGILVFAIRVTPNVEDNMKTTECPHGELYTLACNQCRCNKETGVTLCSASLCLGWQCPLELTHDCYGKCSCNEHTYITTCDKKACAKRARTTTSL